MSAEERLRTVLEAIATALDDRHDDLESFYDTIRDIWQEQDALDGGK